jgi:rubrerythrin
MKNLLDSYLKDTEEFSAMLGERTPGEVAYDEEVVGWLRKGLSIKKALKLAGEKYPTEALHWNEETIQDIKAHYEYLRNHQDIIARIKYMRKTK